MEAKNPQTGDFIKLLSLRKCQLKQIPEEVSEFKECKRLDLAQNQLKEFPINVTQIFSLTKLDLRSNQISSLPEEFALLVNLDEIWLENCTFKEFPTALAKLPKLEYLWFDGNQVASGTIPSDCLLPSVKTASFVECGLKDLGGITNWKTLENLFLSKSKNLQRIPTIAKTGCKRVCYWGIACWN